MTDLQDPKIALVLRFIKGLEDGDLPGVQACFAPDARIWHCFDKDYATPAQNEPSIRTFFEGFTARPYKERRFQLLPKGVLLQFVVGLESTNGKRFDWPGCIVFEIEGDRIVTLEEYVDLATLTAAMA